jgi:hypothetical protein
LNANTERLIGAPAPREAVEAWIDREIDTRARTWIPANGLALVRAASGRIEAPLGGPAVHIPSEQL